MTRYLSIVFFFCMSCFASQSRAQTDSITGDSSSQAKKPLMLSFGFDVKMKSIGGSYDHNYTGEYNVYGQGPSGWEWVNHRTLFNKLLKNSDFSEVKLSVLGSTNKRFKIGLSYNFGSVAGDITEPNYDSLNGGGPTVNNYHTIIYAGICIMTEYDYYFHKKSNTSFYAFANLDPGFYTGSDDIFGPGVPFFIQGKLGVGFDFKNDIMLRAFVAGDQLIYHDAETSQVFHRTQTLNASLNALYVGMGIVKMFTIYPD